MARPDTVVDRLATVGSWMLRVVVPLVFLVVVALSPRLFGVSGTVALWLFVLGVLAYWSTIGLSRSNYAWNDVGPTQRVDVDTFHEGAERCTRCDARISRGLKRRYANQWVLAGIPLYTIEWGENAYCPDCVDPHTLEPLDGPEEFVSNEDADGEPLVDTDGRRERDRT